jgi:hypothetical protein
MAESVGASTWVIADGYIPPTSTGPEPEMTSHDSACILNAGDEDATIELTFFFATREPVGPYVLVAPARRALHRRFNDLAGPEPIPIGVDYCVLLHSNHPVVVQHTRLDSRQAANALMTTIAYPAGPR